MRVLGIESSCDETGVAAYDSKSGLLVHAVHTQIDLHSEYGGVVPELASRDHIRRLVPLIRKVLREAVCDLATIDAVAYTAGPGLAGALLVGASLAEALAAARGIPALPIHHLEGHLLSPMLSVEPPSFPFVALLVSGGHTQLMHVGDVGDYEMLGETLDDAAGEAFDKTAKLMGLGYPGGPQLSRLAESGKPGRFKLPRPMLGSGDLSFSFSGLKTAVLSQIGEQALSESDRADLAAEFEAAVADVLVAKSTAAVTQCRLDQLVVAGGVGANRHLRLRLDEAGRQCGFKVFYPELELCTDNGAMIAFAAALRLQAGKAPPASGGAFAVWPRWPLSSQSSLC